MPTLRKISRRFIEAHARNTNVEGFTGVIMYGSSTPENSGGFMMKNIEDLVLAEAMVRAAENAMSRAEENLTRNREIFRAESHKLIELLQPVFVVTLGKFYAKKYFQPNLNTVCMTFNVPERKVYVDLVLKGQDGMEPTDYFTADDITTLNEDFALVINAKLAELEIFLTFGGFLFPEEYLQS